MGVLDGQVAIVTGAGQGVGRGVALAVAAEGAKVLTLRRTLAKCEAVVTEIEHRGGEAVADRCDIEHRDQVEASVNRTVDRWGRIDLLVNNAQTKIYQSLRRMTEADMETMWQSAPMSPARP
jgi:NAD(P)-dependent dehydrogenase (short-subunit alcohol dehydrogenase family)